MKHLKTYRIFESKDYWREEVDLEIQEHVKILKDMALSLEDKEFSFVAFKSILSFPVRVELTNRPSITINISKLGSNIFAIDQEYYNQEFSYQDVKNELKEMIEYMDTEGWEILEIELEIKDEIYRSIGYSYSGSNYYYCEIEGDRLIKIATSDSRKLDFKDCKREEVNEPFEHLMIKFIEK